MRHGASLRHRVAVASRP